MEYKLWSGAECSKTRRLKAEDYYVSLHRAYGQHGERGRKLGRGGWGDSAKTMVWQELGLPVTAQVR